MVKSKNGKGTMLRALCDSGCSKSIILKEFTEKEKRRSLNEKESLKYKTYGGYFTSSAVASISFKLIEFNSYKNKLINYEVQVDSVQRRKDTNYDIIIGSDLMNDLNIDLLYSESSIRIGQEGNYDRIPMKRLGTTSDLNACSMIYDMHIEPPILQQEEKRQGKLLDANYSKVDIDDMVNELDIPRETKRKLTATLKRFKKLFGGGLGKLDIDPIDIQLKPDAIPYAGTYYNVPKAYEIPFKKEVERMERDDILERLDHANDSPWASPSFCQPKKTMDIRFLSDFREVNKRIVRKPFPLPRIMEALQKIERFKSATALDLSQGYYHIPLTKNAQKICTTILPWGKYSYKRLPMGLASAPDIFQSVMTELFCDLDYVLVYIDDILILQREDETENDHLEKITTVLQRLEDKGFRANLRKSFFMQKEIEYLGYLLTDKGLKPQVKKVEAMKRIKPPTNSKQLKRFLGMINFYRDIWEKRSHILAPLSKLSNAKGKKFIWGKEQQNAFVAAKEMLERQAILSYPDFSQPFDLYTDASDTQLGATLVQKGKPLGFYTRKLNDAQAKYTVGEKELLGIVEGFKAFEGILRGAVTTVHTDHLNLLYQSLPSQRMVRWRLMLEEFAPMFKHVAGVDNDAADALSRLDMLIDKRDTINWEPKLKPLRYIRDNANTQLCHNFVAMEYEEDMFDMDDRILSIDDANAYIEEEHTDCEFALDVRMFKKHQDDDKELQKRIKRAQHTTYFTTKVVEGVELVHHENRIIVPETLKERVLNWYHTMLVHPGQARMEASIRSCYTWLNMRNDVKEHCRSCNICQRCKRTSKTKYGLLPEKEGEVTKWSRVNVDCWGPKTVRNKMDTTTPFM